MPPTKREEAAARELLGRAIERSSEVLLLDKSTVVGRAPMTMHGEVKWTNTGVKSVKITTVQLRMLNSLLPVPVSGLPQTISPGQSFAFTVLVDAP